MRRILALAVLGLLACGIGHVGAQDREGEVARLRAELKRYHGIVNAYRAGEEAAVDEILKWDPERLPKIIAAGASGLDIFRPWDEARIRAAAMLHTDAALRVIDRDEDRISFQLELAARVLAMGGRELHPFAVRWYMALSRLLRDRVLLLAAEGLLERGRKDLPGQPMLLHESGLLQEQIATYAAFIRITTVELPAPRLGGGVHAGMAGVQASEPNPMIAEHRKSLDAAIRFLEQAIDADPSNELSHLHLGRAQILRGRYDAGARTLYRLASSPADPDVGYLATMFLGAMHQRRERYADAEGLYRRAIDKNPSAQSAYIALSEVLQKLGRGDESRATLVRMLERPPPERMEPWWWYLVEPVGEARARVDAIRSEVRK